MGEKEKRVVAVEMEVREVEGEPGRIEGYAAVFNSLSVELWGFREMIEPGAFTETLASGPDVRATIDHQGGLMTLGRTRNGTLSLAQDERGLRVVIVPPDTQAGRDALTLVKRGDVNQMSFMFRVKDEAWVKEENELPLRRLRAIDLEDGDVSIVTYPAYPETSAEARSRAESLGENRPAEPGAGAGRLARRRRLELEKVSSFEF